MTSNTEQISQKVPRRVSLEEVEEAEEVTERLLQDEQSSEGPSKKKRKEEHPVRANFTGTEKGMKCNQKGCKTTISLPKNTTNAVKHFRDSHKRAYAELEPKLNAWNEMRKVPKKTVQKGTENPSDIRLALGVIKTNVYSEGSKRGANIRYETEELLGEYGLSLEDVFKITTDNGSNVCKAYEGKNYLTAPEFWLSEREEEGEAAFEEAEEDFFTNELSGELDELELDFAFPLRIPCAAHVFENTLVAALKSEMANESFKLLKNLIGRFNRSFEAKHELRKYEQVGFIAPSTTRWGYWIDVVERFLEIEKGVRKVSERKGWPFPDARQLTFLKEILPILQPFKVVVQNPCNLYILKINEILREVQGEQFVSISNAFIYVKMAKSVLNGVKSTDHSVREVVDILKSQIIRRFKSLWEIGDTNFDPTYLIASALNPNTISMLDENEISRAAAYIISMITMPSQENPLPKSAHIQSSSSLESFRAHFKQARERSRSASGDKLTAQAITNEALKFLNDCPGNIDPIVYWNSAKKELEPVKELAFKIFAIPATAAPIERVWSKAGSATVHQRSLTKYELLNDQLIVYVNEFLNPQLFSD